MKSASPGRLASWRSLVANAVRGLQHLVRPAHPIQLQSEEENLLQDVAELDQRDPAWYRPNLVMGAQQMLLNGSDVPTVSGVYGEEITSEAARELQLRAFKPEHRVGASS
jgi:hypothetical protein